MRIMGQTRSTVLHENNSTNIQKKKHGDLKCWI